MVGADGGEGEGGRGERGRGGKVEGSVDGIDELKERKPGLQGVMKMGERQRSKDRGS